MQENKTWAPNVAPVGRDENMTGNQDSSKRTEVPGELPAALERHFSVQEIAEMWGLSPDRVRRLFEREPGVLVIQKTGSPWRRRYRTLRVPQSVLERVHSRLCNKGGFANH